MGCLPSLPPMPEPDLDALAERIAAIEVAPVSPDTALLDWLSADPQRLQYVYHAVRNEKKTVRAAIAWFVELERARG